MLVKDPKTLPDKWGKRPSDRTVGELLEGGVIALDKPSGPTSHQVTAWARDALHVEKVTMIHCGGASAIDAAREQWNDGTNTLAVAPGEVIAFSRNYVTNGILRDNGVVVHEIPSAELSRGRGGPRCMSMPLWRE